jgi:NhaP-type Na+/H+ or K+/H+ antiporter
VRQGLNVESGLNDGICVPLLLIALGWAEVEGSAETTSRAVRIVAEEIGYGVVGGVAAGLLAGAILLTLGRRGWVGDGWLQIVPLAGAGLAYGIAVGLGGSGFIAAFVGGGVFGVLRRRFGEEVDEVLEAVGSVLDGLTFLVFGAALLVPALRELTLAGAVYVVLSLTAIRMVPVAVAFLGSGARRPTVAFLGWFGPRGLASIVFAALVVEEASLPGTGTIVSVTFVTVAVSVLAHGVTAAPLVRRYVSWLAANPPGPTMRETAPEAPGAL